MFKHSTDFQTAVEEKLQTLLLAGLDGDAAAYREFLDELSKRLRAYLRWRMVDLRDHVEDVVQETLLAVHKARGTYRRGEPVTAWVHAIARYKLMDFLRAHRRHDVLHAPFDADGDADLFEAPAEPDGDARRDVATLLARLPRKQRMAIELVKLQGVSVEETARRIGWTVSAVKVGVHRGLKALAAQVQAVSAPL